MIKRRLLSAVLSLCIIASMMALCFGASSGVTTSTGIEYNESRIHTMDDTALDAYIAAADCKSHGIVADSDADHGNVLKLQGGSYGRLGFEDFDIKKDRKYYIYFDAKSDTENATAVTLIGINGASSGSCRHFLTSNSNRNDGVQYYIGGQKVTASNFKYSKSWRRYGIILDTSDPTFLEGVKDYSANFWNSSIHFLFGVSNATAYFDNIQVIEIQSLPNAVADKTSVASAVSIRLPKSELENNGSYLSAGLRFMGTIKDDIKLTADEIGFVVTPSASAINDTAWYDISNGVKENVRTAPCFIKNERDTIYTSSSGYTSYQLILTGLSTADGKTAYIQRYSAAMYVKTGDSYTYYSLGETSINEVSAKYCVMNLKAGHINSGIELVLNGTPTKTYLTTGDELPVLNSALSDIPTRHKFIGWYDSTLKNVYTTVPGNVDRLYAKFDGYTGFTYSLGTVYDPNNMKLLSVVSDPFGGKGNVLYTPVIKKNDTIDYGYYRAVAPSAMDGISSTGFDFKKNHTYEVSFYYRYAESDPSAAKCSVDVYAANPAGIYKSNQKSELTATYVEGSSSLTNKGDWTLCRFKVTNTTDYAHMYIRFMGGSTSVIYNLYIDNLSIADLTEDESSVKLVNGGVVESTSLSVGDALPTLEDYDDPLVNRTFEFDGWYDIAMTKKYTTVDSAVNTYYAKYNSYTLFSFETGGMYDPNNSYKLSNATNIASWYRVADPTGADNLCMRSNLTDNGNNTHFALSLFEGSSDGYTLTRGNKYLISFDYYVETTSTEPKSITIRGAAKESIGKNGNKTDSIGSTSLNKLNQWDSTAVMITNTDTDAVDSFPYLIILSQGNHTDEIFKIYLDNIRIMTFAADDDVVYKTPVDNVEFNDNGEVEIYDKSYVGAELADPIGYYGAEFVGWYNETLTVPYSCIPTSNITLYARYNSAINNFETETVFDPNANFGKGNSLYTFDADPTDSTNTVIKVSLKNNVGNTHFAPTANGYTTDGYKMTIGNTYTISFKYYAENLNEKGVSVQFRGCLSENIGISGGKSNGYGTTTLKTEKAWTTQQMTFTYKGAGLTSETHPYLIMLAQDGSASLGSDACTATIYFDDIVIKETEPAKTYTQKSVKAGGWTIGYQPRPHNIVVPSSNFSYLAMMQCEELQTMLKNVTSTATTFNIVYEKDWTEASNQFNIFIGDVAGHSRDNASNSIDSSTLTEDEYLIKIGIGNIYINGGSTYALAMGISECAKMIESAADGASLSGSYSGKYSEKIDSYSTKTYYRPTFLEDFEGTEINTDVWNIIDGSNIEARGFYDEDDVYHSMEDNTWQSIRSPEHTYIENGSLVIDGAYSKEKQTFYGGMLRSHGKLEYRYGYLEVSCITPHGEGLWTATWMTPNGSGTGLYRSEIDVNESFGDARYSAFNMHSWTTSAGSNLGKVKYSLDQIKGSSAKKADAGVTAGFNDGFHTFGYYWTENCGKFTVDGKVKYEYYYDDEHTCSLVNGSVTANDYDAFNEKVSLIVSMTVANPSSGKDPILGADYWTESNKYIVDYVHIYQIDGQEIYFTPPEK